MVDIPDSTRLADLTTSLLSEAAFIFVEPGTDFMAQCKSVIVARITLEYTGTWGLVVVAEPTLGRALAANLLGIDESSAEADGSRADSVAEWSNILAGALAVEFKGGVGACHIGVPAVKMESGAQVARVLDGAASKVHVVSEEGGRMTVALISGS
jgi:hypothetical protein